MELREIITGKNLDKAICSKSQGEAPVQIMEFEEVITPVVTPTVDLLGEDFYGEEGFDMDELDSEGFDGLDAPTPTEEEF